MASTLVNLTLLKVNEELQNIFEFDLDPITQKIFADNYLRQKLIAYVLQRLPNRYLTIETEKLGLGVSRFTVFSTQEKLKIEELIYQGISNILDFQEQRDFYFTYKPTGLACYA
jgi:hypothetical protein